MERLPPVSNQPQYLPITLAVHHCSVGDTARFPLPQRRVATTWSVLPSASGRTQTAQASAATTDFFFHWGEFAELSRTFHLRCFA